MFQWMNIIYYWDESVFSGHMFCTTIVRVLITMLLMMGGLTIMSCVPRLHINWVPIVYFTCVRIVSSNLIHM